MSLWHDEVELTQVVAAAPEAAAANPESEVLAWEQIEAGRYMPRRIRGSYRGRELGWTFVVPPGSGATNVKGQESNVKGQVE